MFWMVCWCVHVKPYHIGWFKHTNLARQWRLTGTGTLSAVRFVHHHQLEGQRSPQASKISGFRVPRVACCKSKSVNLVELSKEWLCRLCYIPWIVTSFYPLNPKISNSDIKPGCLVWRECWHQPIRHIVHQNLCVYIYNYTGYELIVCSQFRMVQAMPSLFKWEGQRMRILKEAN